MTLSRILCRPSAACNAGGGNLWHRRRCMRRGGELLTRYSSNNPHPEDLLPRHPVKNATPSRTPSSMSLSDLSSRPYELQSFPHLFSALSASYSSTLSTASSKSPQARPSCPVGSVAEALTSRLTLSWESLACISRVPGEPSIRFDFVIISFGHQGEPIFSMVLKPSAPLWPTAASGCSSVVIGMSPPSGLARSILSYHPSSRGDPQRRDEDIRSTVATDQASRGRLSGDGDDPHPVVL